MGCLCGMQLLFHLDKVLPDVIAGMAFSSLSPLCQLTQHHVRKIQCERPCGDVKVPYSTCYQECVGSTEDTHSEK